MSDQDFEAQVLETLARIGAERVAVPRQDGFVDVLERFAKTLSKHPSLGATVEEVAEVPGGRRLVMWPKLRRDERATMLNFARTGGTFLLLGQGRRELKSPKELEGYLKSDFLVGSAFPETLAAFEERCKAPTRGFLRRGGPSEVSPGDVLVRLDPDEQRRLAETAPGQDVTVLAREDRLPSTSLYQDAPGTYTCLVAGGYGMWAMFVSRAEDGRLRVAGSVMGEEDLG